MIPVTMMMAITVDGKIAKDKNQLADWTSREDKKLFVEISKQHGVIMMGENTFKTFPAPLPGRLNVVFSRADNPPPITGVKWVKCLGRTGKNGPYVRSLGRRCDPKLAISGKKADF